MLGLGDNLIEVPELVGIVDLLCVVGGGVIDELGNDGACLCKCFA